METDVVLVTQNGECKKTCQLMKNYSKKYNKDVEILSIDSLLKLFTHEGRTKGLLFVCLTKNDYWAMATTLSTITDHFKYVEIVLVFNNGIDGLEINKTRNRFIEVLIEDNLSIDKIKSYENDYTKKVVNIVEPDYLVVTSKSKVRKIDKRDIILIEKTKNPGQVALIGLNNLLCYDGNLKVIERSLGNGFYRISNSCIVNISFITDFDLGIKKIDMTENIVRRVSFRKVKGLQALLEN